MPDSWRKALYVLVAPFASLASLVLAVAGLGRLATGIQRRLARGLLGMLEDPQVRTYGDTAVVVGQQNQSGRYRAIRFRLVRSTRRLYSSTSRAGGGRPAAT